jgi:hypothetical protein
MTEILHGLARKQRNHIEREKALLGKAGAQDSGTNPTGIPDVRIPAPTVENIAATTPTGIRGTKPALETIAAINPIPSRDKSAQEFGHTPQRVTPQLDMQETPTVRPELNARVSPSVGSQEQTASSPHENIGVQPPPQEKYADVLPPVQVIRNPWYADPLDKRNRTVVPKK